jgi:hypothetical protein
MSFAKFSPEDLLLRGLQDLDCTKASFAHIANIPSTAVSLALSGHTAFTNLRGVHALKVLVELRDLAASTGGIPISFANPTLIRELLDRRRDQRRTPEPRLFSVSIDGRWFVGRDCLGSIGLTIGIIQAAAMTAATADLLLAALKNSGIDASVHPNPFCGPDAMGSSFESLWGLQPQEEAKEPAAPVTETNVGFEAQ